jgi:hypothetical protein
MNIIYIHQYLKLMNISLGWAMMNIGGVQFNFDPAHIFVGAVKSLMNKIHVYLLVTWQHRRRYDGYSPTIFIG